MNRTYPNLIHGLDPSSQSHPSPLSCSHGSVLLPLQVIDHKEPLLAISRLDHCTEGLLVVAKSPRFAAYYNKLLHTSLDDGSPSIRKYYLALSEAAPPLGQVQLGHASGPLPSGPCPLKLISHKICLQA